MNHASYVVWDSTCVSQGQLLFVFTSIGILFYYLRWESWQLLVISASGTLDLVNLHKVGGPDWLLEVSLGIAVALANQSSKTTRSSRKKNHLTSEQLSTWPTATSMCARNTPLQTSFPRSVAKTPLPLWNWCGALLRPRAIKVESRQKLEKRALYNRADPQ